MYCCHVCYSQPLCAIACHAMKTAECTQTVFSHLKTSPALTCNTSLGVPT